MNLKVIEPLKLLFKDEVRRVGNSLQINQNILGRHPFPGPGLAIRILGLITETLQNNDRLEVRNFGSFSVRKREQRISRNPKTGTSILVQSKSHPYFRASKFLKESLNK